MDLGDYELGLGVRDIRRSIAFYRTLGFSLTDGSIEERAVTLRYGDCRIALYEGHGVEPVFLNFREGDVQAIARELEGRGLVFDKPPFTDKDGDPGALLRDPDGNAVYFCSHEGAARR